MSNKCVFLISKIFLSIFISKNAMRSHHNFILRIAAHVKCSQGTKKLNNKFSLL